MKRIYSIMFLFLAAMHLVIPVHASQAEQKSWFSYGVDLVKESIVTAMFAALVYKAKEYGIEQELAENEIKWLKEKLEAIDLTEEDKEAVNTEIKKYEAIRNQKKTLGQKVAQVTLGLMGTVMVGGMAWALWNPYPENREINPEHKRISIEELRKRVSIEEFLKK